MDVPGAPLGLQKQDPTVAELLKPLGYATGHFGKNHMGDRNEFLPTVHGFDEFYGNLYHLNAEEAPEHADYPTEPEFRERSGPRGVLHCVATPNETPGGDARSGRSRIFWDDLRTQVGDPRYGRRKEREFQDGIKSSDPYDSVSWNSPGTVRDPCADWCGRHGRGL